MTKSIWGIALLTIILSPSAYARAAGDEIAELRDQIRALTQRLDALEEQNNAANRQSVSSSPGAQATVAPLSNATVAQIDQAVDAKFDERMSASAWTEKIRWTGDFRYRYENTELEGQDSRNRQRIRARAHLEAKISPTLTAGLGMASGGDDPVSTNQTLGGGGSSKGLNLDLAYFQWTGMRDTTVIGGKFKNILYRPGKSGLLWDGDWNPEGAAIKWENGRYFATGLGTWVESDSNKTGQEFSYGIQAGAKFALSDDVELVAGAGYFRFDSAGKPAFFGDDDDFFGNSFDPDRLVYIHDYHELELFADLKFQLFGRPASVFADYVHNTAPSDNDTGFAIGFKTGSAKARGSWDLALIYEDLEADAVLGLLTDSDFGGGGTDAKGYVLKGTYALNKNMNAKLSYFINDVGISTGNERDLDRLQLDLNLKY